MSYGHLVVTAIGLLLCLWASLRKWPRWAVFVLGAVTLWSGAAFLVARLSLNVNGRLALPTQQFLVSGEGRVLDMGAGTGRSTLMVLEQRPRTTVVALDLFADSFNRHFGEGPSGQSRLQANLQAAGVAQRAAIQTADMRKVPFDPATFDGVVSTYAIDHLNRDGITQALGEAARVLKPRGEFLLMVIAKDFWLKFTFGPLLLHSGTRGPEWWANQVRAAGFEIVEEGMRPATLYVLARKTALR